MAIIPPHYINSVVAIGQQLPDKVSWIGTGFLVSFKEDNPEFSTVYLITNKHVVENQAKVIIRFNSKASNVKDYHINLYPNNTKIYSEHPSMDIVAIQINPNVLINDESEFGIIDLEDNALSSEQMSSTGVTEGTIVYALGFPMNLVENNRKAPICRMGCISRSPNINSSDHTFIIDAQAFPGNSGGPVFNRPEFVSIGGTVNNSSANLIGIVSSYIQYVDSLISNQTQQVVSIVRENSGLTNVLPVEYIIEVVQMERNRCLSKMTSNKNERQTPREWMQGLKKCDIHS